MLLRGRQAARLAALPLDAAPAARAFVRRATTAGSTRRPAKDSPRRQQGGGTLFDGLRSARVSKDVLELLNQHGAGIRVNDFGFLLSKLMQLEASPAGGRGSAAGKLSTDARRVMEVAARQLPALLRDAIAAPAKGGSARQHSKARFSALSNVIEAFHTAAGGDEEVLELAAAAAAESLAAGHPASVSRSASGLAAHGHLRGPFLAALASRVEAEAAAQLLARGASPPTPAAADEGDEASAAPAPRSPASPAAAAAGRSEEAAATAAKAALAALPAEPMDGFALLVTCTAAVGVLQRSPPSLAEDVAAAWRLVTAADEALPLLLPATQPRRRAANCVSAVDVVGRAIVGAPSPAEARALLSSSAVLSSDWVIRTVGGADGQAAAVHLSRARQILARAASARSGDDGHAEAAAAAVADALDAATSDDEGRSQHQRFRQPESSAVEEGLAAAPAAAPAASSDAGAAAPSAGPARPALSANAMQEQRAIAAALRASTSADEALAVWEAQPAAFDPHLFANAASRIAAHIQRGADSSPPEAASAAASLSAGAAAPAGPATRPSSSPASVADVAVSPLWPRARSFLRSARAAARTAMARGVVLHPGVTANLVWGMCRLEQAFPPVDTDDAAADDGPARARHATDPDEAGDFSRCLAELAAQAAPMVSNGTMAPLNVARLLAGLDAARLGVVARAAGVVSAAEQRLEDDVDAFDDWQCVTTCFSGTRLGCRLGPNATEDLAKRARALLDDCAPAALAQAPRPGAPQAAPVAETAHRLCVFALWALLHTPQRRQWQADARARAYLQAPAVAALLAQGFAASLAELMEPDEAAAGDESEDRRLMRRLRRAETVAQVAAALESAPGLLDLRHCVEASERLLRVERAVPEDSSDVDALLSRRARRARAQEAFNAVAAELGGRIAEASRHAAASGAMTMDFASHLLFCAGRLPLPASQRRDLVATLKPVILKALKGAATGQAIDQRDVPRALAGLAQARADDSELTTALLRHFVNHSDDCTAVNALMVLQAVNTLVSPPAVLLEKAMHRADDVICLAARKDDSGLTPGFAASALVLLVSELGMVSSQAALSLVPVLRRTASSLTPELARDAQAAVLEVIRHRTKGGGAAGDRA
ncbi:hypothetical protein FNF31_06269 [Cafeteria roenbergensis]|uniref:Uncharacterized protein n=1 Tax=Cafeteria roenbergensis TaxID=33653 RepID=A0A5A8CQB5_CAFRO|nr:hypothetical protein FNF31_06269 [Cafeteria roenbergensis]